MAKRGIVSDGFNLEEIKAFRDIIDWVVEERWLSGVARHPNYANRLLDPFDPLTTGLDKLKAFQVQRRIAEEEGEGS
jgi:hypothetical protein